MCRQERSEEMLNWEAIKAKRGNKKDKGWQRQEVIQILSVRLSKNELREIIEKSTTIEKFYGKKVSVVYSTLPANKSSMK